MAKQDGIPRSRIVRTVVQRLEDLRRAGITHLPKPKRPPAGPTDRAVPCPVVAPSSGEPAGPADQPDDRAAALARLERKVAACRRCAELARTRTQTVFGDGNPNAELVFMGEAPGGDEDRLGRPFVGAAGQLLTDIIVKGMKLRREDVYILNTIKCRPPGNRTPAPEEIANCREYLDGQLAILRPKYLCCLGAVAAQSLLDTTTPIGRLRGRVHEHHGIKVVCTYHPAYLLRTPSAKRQTWDDIQLLMAEMGLEVKR